MSPQGLAVAAVVVCVVCSLVWAVVIDMGLRRRKTYDDVPMWRAPMLQLAGWGIALIFAMVGVIRTYEYGPLMDALYYSCLSMAAVVLVTTLGVMLSNRTTAC